MCDWYSDASILFCKMFSAYNDWQAITQFLIFFYFNIWDLFKLLIPDNLVYTSLSRNSWHGNNISGNRRNCFYWYAEYASTGEASSMNRCLLHRFWIAWKRWNNGYICQHLISAWSSLGMRHLNKQNTIYASISISLWLLNAEISLRQTNEQIYTLWSLQRSNYLFL